MKWLNEKKYVTVYLASGWFNPPQEAARQDIPEPGNVIFEVDVNS